MGPIGSAGTRGMDLSEFRRCAANDSDGGVRDFPTRLGHLRELQKAIEAVLAATDRAELGRVGIHIDHANQILAKEIAKLDEAL